MSFRYLDRQYRFDEELSEELSALAKEAAEAAPTRPETKSLEDLLDPVGAVKSIISSKEQRPTQDIIKEHGVRQQLKKVAEDRRQVVLGFLKEGE